MQGIMRDRTRRTVKKLMAISQPATVGALRSFNRMVRKVASASHHAQLFFEWSVNNPEWFDHYIDQYYLWHETRASFPWERGVFSGFSIRGNGRVLDLCSGDGFNAYHFYSLRAKEVVAVDFDDSAIRWARKHYSAPNLRFVVQDVRDQLPDGPFSNVIWDAAIEHFNETEIAAILKRIKTVLEPNGLLSGYTIMEREDGVKMLHQHEYEFESKEDLVRVLSPYFANVQVLETCFPQRTNYYFFATDGTLPFAGPGTLTVEA